MVSFNEECYRLGYGGGFYDRTIDLLKNTLRRDVLTIGIAFFFYYYDALVRLQKIEDLPEF